jgi:hypothetical protein
MCHDSSHKPSWPQWYPSSVLKTDLPGSCHSAGTCAIYFHYSTLPTVYITSIILLQTYSKIHHIYLNIKHYTSSKLQLKRKQLLSPIIFMVVPCINDIKFFIVQLMHTNYIKMWITKTFKMITVAPTCFSLYKPSSGSHKQYIVKITLMVQVYMLL